MRIQLIDGRIPTTPGMSAFVHARLTAALDRFASRIREVIVRITDVNGPKGGLDKRCIILATVGGGGQVIARSTDSDFYAAIGKAVATLKSLVGRRIQRGHTKNRDGGVAGRSLPRRAGECRRSRALTRRPQGPSVASADSPSIEDGEPFIALGIRPESAAPW